MYFHVLIFLDMSSLWEIWGQQETIPAIRDYA